MTFWLALRRLLPLLAVLSLALTPVASPAATAGMHAPSAQGRHATAMDGHGMGHGMGHAAMDHATMGHHAAQSAGMADVDTADVDMGNMDMGDMPCCPKTVAAEPDCGKGCPLMALCLASMASLPPAPIPVPVPVATRAGVIWPDPAAFASVDGTPYPEPPRA
ncbi:hypothetical protein [Methylobacterium aerolatum]|uniref:Uncharacterized protein n=1 Tax=Methylobacterium aerolatum TaxID=418708 RepID=A0ABU0I6B4_9HYPH|nr:hypothetical protein [Methylobacterium aerolatum]MDQ0449174.1 hypothetical protein [Methylobacterium aerolatum]GJD35361.1 hypothetical protein FMGBMHLM_2271 [Methylobacterium aerolatum]